MDGERSNEDDGFGGDSEAEDEFACAGVLRGSLTSLHSTVERIFRVAFGIGTDDLPHGNSGQIWLKLRGSSSSVKAAKVRHISWFLKFGTLFKRLNFCFDTLKCWLVHIVHIHIVHVQV